jgi:hypothetical protein
MARSQVILLFSSLQGDVAMKTHKIVAAVILALASLFGSAAGSAFAASNGTDHLGPFPSGSVLDTGSCGNSWANDTFIFFVSVHNNGDGTFNLTIDERDGTFTTIGSVSPGACESTNNHGSSVQPGILGQLHGFLTGTVTSSQYNPNACNGNPSPCNFLTFGDLVFGPAASGSFTHVNIEYQSSDQSLKYHHWLNNISGTNVQFEGDIANQ